MHRAPPKFLICIGAQRSATTWLSEQLRRHPDFSLPPRKEIRYFDAIYTHNFETVRAQRLREVRSRLNKILVDKIELTPGRARDVRWHANYAIVAREQYNDQWYWSLFASVNHKKITGDFSPDYSLLPEAGIRHMKACAPHARLFFVLRNPIDRIWSGAVYALRHEVAAGRSPSPERVRAAVSAKIQWDFSNYRTIIEAYEDVFGRGSINFLFYDTFLSEPLQFLEQFCEMNKVGCDASWFPQFGKRVNEGPRLQRDPEIVREIAVASRDQVDWLAQRFGGIAEAWRKDLESIA